MSQQPGPHGGDRVAQALLAHGIDHMFTLCGGHVSPILAAAKARGIRVVATRHEANAVFAADAWARIHGKPGVAVVTAGPGVSNSVTALKNAQLAQSPLLLIGGAAPTLLQGRGALQDIAQAPLVKPHVKACFRVRRVAELGHTVSRALALAASGVPGPVFVECPVDLLYAPEIVKSWYSAKSRPGRSPSLQERALATYLDIHTWRMFAGAEGMQVPTPRPVAPPAPEPAGVRDAAKALHAAKRPVLVIGSQAMALAGEVRAIAGAVEAIGIPTYLSGMARGLLGAGHRLQMRHGRKAALKDADLVILAGVPCDFRLDYGQHISRKATYIAANRSEEEMDRNRHPHIPVAGDAGRFLQALAQASRGVPANERAEWIARLRGADDARDAEIVVQAGAKLSEETDAPTVNPLDLCRRLETSLPDNSVLVADGGDFVATASYILRPRGPLSWLDPGVFGTLGVGAGFALGAKLVRPEAETWILYGDGSVGYSLAEFDTFVRHQIPVIGLVGNDASWAQIARDQVEMLGDAVGTELRRSDYHTAAAGLGALGLELRQPDRIDAVFAEARVAAKAGRPVLINAHLRGTDFRKGSISM